MDGSAKIPPKEFIRKSMEHLKQYNFLFENLAFAGGGAKGVAYLGCIEILDELDILSRVKRFSGTSAGSIFAMLLSVGLNVEELTLALKDANLKDLVEDESRAWCLWNIWQKFGWCPAKKFEDYLRDLLEKKTHYRYMTFKEVYRRYQKQLCIVGTNVSSNTVKYFHPKTTPDYDIVTAVRLSASLPVLLQPVEITIGHDVHQYIVDGGLVCNFPLHAFDGWYLSMKQDDRFFNKLNFDGRFEPFNPRTLGFALLTAKGVEFMQDVRAALVAEANIDLNRPDTALARTKGAASDAALAIEVKSGKIMQAAKAFYDGLTKDHNEESPYITKEEFAKAYDELVLKEHELADCLFKCGQSADSAFGCIDKSGAGKINMTDFIDYMESKGINYLDMLEGGSMCEAKTFRQFFWNIYSTVSNFSRKVYFKENDRHRTVTVYTDYISTTDFDLEDGDKEFLIQQGKVGCVCRLAALVAQCKSEEENNPVCNIIKPKGPNPITSSFQFFK